MQPKILSKSKLAEALAREHNTTIMQMENIVESFLNRIKIAVREDQKISLGSFGIFTRKVRVARKCRNPRTGKEIMVGSMNVVKFTPAIAFKEFIK